MPKPPKADFCIEIQFRKGSENPSRVFRTMYELIESFQVIDEDLVRSIDAKIEPVAVIEDVESGSIRAWLKYVLRSVDDDALKNIDWKPAVGRYLVRAKYFILNFMENKTEITNREEVEQLESGLLKLAEETDVRHHLQYKPVDRQKLLPDISKINDSLSHLNDSDKAIYKTSDSEVHMNAQFRIVPENIEELLTQETIRAKSEMILIVKKPDYLGESQWEFKHGKSPIIAKILAKQWLLNFQSRKYDVRPGDALRALEETETKYGYEREIVAIHHSILEVIEIIKHNSPEQMNYS